MSGGIFHIDGEDRLVELTEKPYDSEEVLQKLLQNYPELLAGDQISSDSPRRWLFIGRELGIPGDENGNDRWSVDHVFVDQDGIPTIVEVKRSSDTRIRREVVGQMLDYAANAVVYWPAGRIRTEFEAGCRKRDGAPDPAEQLADFLDEKNDAEKFWEEVQNNLQAGRLRLLFVADHIPDELRRIIEFLNEQMERTEVLGVEIRQFVGGGVRSLVPRVLGQTASSENRKRVRRPNRQWNEPLFMQDLRDNASQEAAAVAEKLIDWTRREIGEPRWGTGATMGSFSASFSHGDNRHILFDVWSTGRASIRFTRLKDNPPYQEEAARVALMNRFNEIAGIDLKNAGGWPEFRLESLSSPSALEQFLAIIRSMEKEIRKQEADSTE